MRPHMPAHIHPAQTAFIQGRHIATNIIIAQETVHSFNLRSWKSKGFMVKIDLEKSFDKIEWPFILQALGRKGYSKNFIDRHRYMLASAALAFQSCSTVSQLQAFVLNEESDKVVRFHPLFFYRL